MKTKIAVIFVALLFAWNPISAQSVDDKIYEAIRLINNSDLSSAIRLLNEVLDEHPNHYGATYELALAHFLNKNYEKTAELLQRAVTMPDATDQTFAMLGNAYDMCGDKEKAMTTYNEGLKKFPKSGYLYTELGITSAIHENYDDAISYHWKGIQADPDFSSNYYWATKIYASSSEPMWALVLGEMYLAVEKFNAKRLYEVSGIIAQTYRSMLEIEGDSITVKQSQPINIYIDEKSDDPEQFVKAMMKLSVQFPASLHIAAAIEAPDSIDAETLCLIRERFTDQIVSNEILWKKYPNPFVSHLVAVRNAGVENAYLHYILLLNNPAELKKMGGAASYRMAIVCRVAGQLHAIVQRRIPLTVLSPRNGSAPARHAIAGGAFQICFPKARRRLCWNVSKYCHCDCTFVFTSNSGLLSAHRYLHF